MEIGGMSAQCAPLAPIATSNFPGDIILTIDLGPLRGPEVFRQGPRYRC